MKSEIHVGDCLEVMKTLDAESIDAIVTDPPYGLSFMDKDWDHSIPGESFWSEALRVAKPGTHLLAFGGTRTFHRLTVAIEDAGWEIRDCIMWVYGSGFTKSHDVSKAIDRMDASEEQERRRRRFTAWVRSTGVTSRQIDAATGTNMGGHYTTAASQPAIMTREHLEACRHLLGDVPEWVEREADIRSVESRNMAAREIVGKSENGQGRGWAESGLAGYKAQFNITAPATPAAQKWQGWGTALKPAWEPIIVARKPLVGTVAQNVQAFGTGAVNVDGCRVDAGDDYTSGSHDETTKVGGQVYGWAASQKFQRCKPHDSGRWPANLIHDGSDEVTGLMGDAARFFYCAKASKADRDEGCEGLESRVAGGLSGRSDGTLGSVTMSRNVHPTVKPTSLMRYLCRLVTPPGGTVLDPFCGSGSTGKAAVMEGFSFIGIELNPEYAAIAEARIQAEIDKTALLESAS